MRRLALLSTLVIFMTVSLGGCLKNEVIYPVTDDGVTGFYGTEPTALEFCVRPAGGSTTCPPHPITEIPNYVSGIVTHPVILQKVNPQPQGAPAIVVQIASAFNPDPNQLTFPTYVDIDAKTLGSTAPLELDPFWNQADCKFTRNEVISGSWDEGQTEEFPSGSSKIVTRGRLNVLYTNEHLVEGAGCGATMAEIQACYQNETLCVHPDYSAATWHQFAQELFDPGIAVGSLEVSDIPTLEYWSFTATYE